MTATGTLTVEGMEEDITLTLSGDTIAFKGRFTDDQGGAGTMSATLTRE